MPGTTEATLRDDSELIDEVRTAAAGGDAVAGDLAVRALYERHHDAALRYAYTLTDPTTAEDLAAEAFLRVIEAVRRGHGPRVSFRPYLYTALRNLQVSVWRRSRRMVLVDTFDEGLSPEVHDSSSLSDEILMAALDSLPTRWKRVLWDTAVEGHDHATVAQFLEITPNAVAQLSLRARQGLKRAYLAAAEAHAG